MTFETPVSGTLLQEKLGLTISTYVDRDLFDDLPVPMIDTSVEGRIIRANSAACSLLGRGG
ncbi:MAG: PAS domain-containing protein [Alphaproteobacteria bacterium]